MMKKIRIVVITILISIIVSCPGTGPKSPVNSKKNTPAYTKALRLQGNKEYDKAADLLKKILEKDGSYYLAYKSLLEIYKTQENLEELADYFERRQAADPSNPFALNTLGHVYFHQGFYDKSIRFFKKAISLNIDFYSPYIGLVLAYGKKAEKESSAAAEGEHYLKELIRLNPRMGGPHYGLGYFYIEQEKYDEALAELNRVEGNDFLVMHTYYVISCVNWYTNDTRSLLEPYRKVITLARKVDDQNQEAYFLAKTGLAYYNLSDFRKALGYYNKALAIYKDTGNKWGEGWIYSCFGSSYRRQSDYVRALEYAEKAVILLEENNDTDTLGWTISDIGLIYYHLSNYDKAISYYKKALVRFKKVDDKVGEGWTCVYLGKVQYSLGEYSNSLEYFEKALTLFTESNNRYGKVTGLTELGLAYYSLHDYQKALDYHNLALSLARDNENKSEEAGILTNIGLVYSGLSDNKKTAGYYERALALQQQAGDRESESSTLGHIGNAYLAQKEYKKAFSFYTKAIDITESIRGSFRNEEFKTGFFQKKSKLYANSITCLYEMHRQNPSQEYDRLAFTYAEKSKARGLLDLLTESNADIRQGIDPELAKQERKLEKEYSRINTDLHDLLSQPVTGTNRDKIADLETRLEAISGHLEELKVKIVRKNPRYGRLKYPEPTDSRQIQQNLLDDTTLCIEYKVTDKAVFAWGLTRDKFVFYKLDIEKEELDGRVRALRSCLTGMFEEEIFAAHSAPLYTILLSKLLDNQRITISQDKLLIIPDGILHYLPFETLIALPGARQGENTNNNEETNLQLTYETMPFLLKKYQVRYAQSAAVAYNLIQRNQRKKEQLPPGELLALGDPVFSPDESAAGSVYTRSMLKKEERSKLKRLVYSGEEVKNISRLFTDSAVYVRENATEEQLKMADLENYRYIHLAAHGILNEDNPGLSGIILAQDNDPEEDGYLLTGEIFNLKLNADLVVLSACSTGLGKQVAGEGIVGLTRAWLYAGASSLVVSLWNINDYSTSALMESFYKNIRTGASYSRALREAKLEMIERGNGDNSIHYANPYFWAGFVLLGGE